MKGVHRFSPETGAELSRERHRPGTIPFREPLDGSGLLSNGKLVSESSTAVLKRFRACYERHHDRDPELYSAAAVAVRELRKEDPWDVWLWFALAERLHRRGFDIEWMFAHATPRCPRCSSTLRVEPVDVGYPALKCASSCGQDTDRTIEVYDAVQDLYERAFGSVERLQVVDRA